MTINMYDSIQENVPKDAKAVAGYVGGRWPSFFVFERDFPTLVKEGKVLSIAVNRLENARCLDIEAGDATASDAPAWLRHNADRSHGTPWLYTSASNVNNVVAACKNAGIARSDYYVWSAHYTMRPHVCAPHVCGYPQADGTQFTDKANGINLDESLLNDYMFPQPAPPFPIGRFANDFFPVPQQWFNGKHPNLANLAGQHKAVNEHQIVEEFRKLNENPAKNGGPLHVYRQALVFLRKRVWFVAHQQKLHGMPSWGMDWRGWRWQQLAQMTEGVKQEW